MVGAVLDDEARVGLRQEDGATLRLGDGLLLEPQLLRLLELLRRLRLDQAKLEATAQIEELCISAPDCVLTHGDFKTHNLLVAPDGPVLIDWDSVRVDSAALEAGRVAYIFGAGELDPVRRILTAYVESGGNISWIGSSLFASVVRNQLQIIFEHVFDSTPQIGPTQIGTPCPQGKTRQTGPAHDR